MLSVNTLFWIVPATFGLFAIAFLMIAVREKAARYCIWFSACFFLAVIGAVLDIELRQIAPWLSGLAPVLHFLAVACVSEGLLRRLKRSALAPLSALVLSASVVHLMLLGSSDVTPRIINVSIFVSLIIATAVWRMRDRKSSGINSAIYWLLVGLVLSYALRLAVYFATSQQTEGVSVAMPWSQYNVLFYITNGLFAIALALAAMLATGMDVVAGHHVAARIDPLTGIANRRAANDWMAADAAGRRRYGAVMIVDLDRFKQLNDAHGHAAGDAVLVAAAQALLSSLGSFARIARIGGEEFAVFVDGVHADAAGALAVAARAAVGAARPASPFTEITVTASIGLAARRDDESLEATMRRADMALYEAKSTGRNCAVAARCNDGHNVMVA